MPLEEENDVRILQGSGEI